jgi:hypothetical protein
MNKQQRRIQLYFFDNFTALTPERQAAAKDAVAALLKVAPESLPEQETATANRKVNLCVPAQVVEDLHTLLQTNNGSLRLLGLKKVILERASTAIEAWAVENGQFNLVARAAPTIDEAGKPVQQFEPVPRIWLFHLIYLFVTLSLAASILRFSYFVSLSLIFITAVCALGLLLVWLRRFMAAHILAVAIGLGAPVVVFARLWPLQTILLFFFLILGIFIIRRSVL